MNLDIYPKNCHENIRTIIDELQTDPKTAYAMILMTATLMDLRPEDPETAEMVIADFNPVCA